MLIEKIFLVLKNPLDYPEFLPTFFAFSSFLLFLTYSLFYFLRKPDLKKEKTN
jgi:hypothetical protein